MASNVALAFITALAVPIVATPTEGFKILSYARPAIRTRQDVKTVNDPEINYQLASSFLPVFSVNYTFYREWVCNQTIIPNYENVSTPASPGNSVTFAALIDDQASTEGGDSKRQNIIITKLLRIRNKAQEAVQNIAVSAGVVAQPATVKRAADNCPGPCCRADRSDRTPDGRRTKECSNDANPPSHYYTNETLLGLFKSQYTLGVIQGTHDFRYELAALDQPAVPAGFTVDASSLVVPINMLMILVMQTVFRMSADGTGLVGSVVDGLAFEMLYRAMSSLAKISEALVKQVEAQGGTAWADALKPENIQAGVTAVNNPAIRIKQLKGAFSEARAPDTFLAGLNSPLDCSKEPRAIRQASL